MSKTLDIILNGKRETGYQGETILELARRKGIEIPTLCYDPRLEPYSSCYTCVVEVKDMKGMQPSCSTKITEGMKIETDNEEVYAARKASLDLLVSNHYADCKAPCTQECPAGVDVQGYISLIEKGLYTEAIELIKETNPLPAVCGRVCVRPCEAACRRNLLDEDAPVGIDYLKRYAADVDLLENDNHYKPVKKPFNGKHIAIIGAGPGGLSAAYFLQPKGFQCDIFEANNHPGGWLRYGIPEYRLPNDMLDKEVSTITELGTKIYYNKKLGDNLHYDQLKKEYDAVILTIGSQRGTLIGCEGDDAENVFSGIDFLRNMEQTGQKYDFAGKTVAVVGGGNTAMDCCRTATRCNADKVYIIYRRAEEQMPANPIEIHESKLEGVEYMLLTNPSKVNKDENGKLKSLTLIKMELGEPDASGRRRPIPIEGSEFELEVDFVLAAIGQKTQVDFIDDINEHSEKGELKLNRWGDINADEKTLQTGIPHVFAAGDGVTGPATVIEAIDQAKTAARSVEQYLDGMPFTEPPQEFISRKDNFKKQEKSDYVKRYRQQARYEMPVMEPEQRNNFKEVELGYQNEELVKSEASRCMECGCSEFYDCDLQRHATTYNAEQDKYAGDFNEYQVNFDHPFIEIDNNKCILCSRCVRICQDVVGANALGLVNRGFDTCVSPAMGERLQDTNCESCGMCISACPTGAITENVPFKPGPVRTEPVDAICNFCSIGCELTYHHKGGFVMGTSGKEEGLVNKHGNICRFPKFGYHYLNDPMRLKKPLLRKNDNFVEISFPEAYQIIQKKIKEKDRNENAFFAGARLSNEEMYLIQKLARAGVKTNNIESFHYLGRGEGYQFASWMNTPFQEIDECSKIWLLGAELNNDNAVVGFMVNDAAGKHEIPVALITNKDKSSMEHKVDEILKIDSYYHFIRAANYLMIDDNMVNEMFVNDRTKGFHTYRDELLKEDIDQLINKAGINIDQLKKFVTEFNEEVNALLITEEKHLTSNVMIEVRNLMLLTGKLGKTAMGLINLKEKNNSQGLLDMGVGQKYGVGSAPVGVNEILNEKMQSFWQINDLPDDNEEPIVNQLNQGKVKNLFIFGEDPVGCTISSLKEKVDKWIEKADFVMVQDYFMTETAEKADLILPASLPYETGGSYTNAEKKIQTFEKQEINGVQVNHDNIRQLAELHKLFGLNGMNDVHDVFMEAVSLLPTSENTRNIPFIISNSKDGERMFNYGCDFVVKRFETESNEKLSL
ncbi:MAG: FAD-dependent oxidoreductase [Bacteroidales bacterium]|nr:FAD-dependent oxidoreductase [Bacteroidales bacterium]